MTDDLPPIPDEPAPVVRRRHKDAEEPAPETDADAADTDADEAAIGGSGGDDTDADTDDTDEPGDTPDPATRARIVIAVVAVLVLAAVGWLLFGRGEEVVSPRPTTTTTSKAPTTTAAEAWPAGITQVATAKAGTTKVAVLSTPPPEWETATPVQTWSAEALPASDGDLPERPPLPRTDYPVQGRYATETGWEFSNPTSFDQPLTFLVTEVRGNWAKVMIPVRPNHTEGWVNLADVDLSDTDYRIELDISDRHLVAYKGSEVIVETPVVVGKDATRTPTGRFFVTDKVTNEDPEGFYGPYVLPIDAYSEQLDTFDNGVPVIAIHGTSRPDLLGQDASNGCIRIPNDVVTTLNDQVPLGTQVEIVA